MSHPWLELNPGGGAELASKRIVRGILDLKRYLENDRTFAQERCVGVGRGRNSEQVRLIFVRALSRDACSDTAQLLYQGLVRSEEVQ